jgi:hypothetical protein
MLLHIRILSAHFPLITCFYLLGLIHKICVIKPSVARLIFLSSNAKGLSLPFQSTTNDTFAGGVNISSIDLFERLTI